MISGGNGLFFRLTQSFSRDRQSYEVIQYIVAQYFIYTMKTIPNKFLISVGSAMSEFLSINFWKFYSFDLLNVSRRHYTDKR